MLNAVRVELTDQGYRHLAEQGLLPLVQSPDILCSQPKPIFATIKDGIVFEAIDGPWIESALSVDRNDMQGGKCADSLGYPIPFLDLIECNFCRSQGSIIAEWPKEGANCPYCDSLIVEPHTRWMT